LKKEIEYFVKGEKKRREISFIPLRFIIAIILTALEVCAILAIMVYLCYRFPLFYLAAILTQVFCVLHIIASDDNPDYKVPWLLCVLVIPVAGFMLYFLFYSRKLKPRFIKRLENLKNSAYKKDCTADFQHLKEESAGAFSQAKMLCNIAETNLFTHTETRYFSSGESMFESLLQDLKKAESFIFMEYFIIEQGVFWDSILEVLKEKAVKGVDVRVVYDDIGCMKTLPGDYYDELRKYGIKALPFAPLKGNADSEFNNRSHRKITVIDGKIGYTGGVNIADEYINKVKRFGHWKDSGIRLCGEAVWELCKLFVIDYGINTKSFPSLPENCYPQNKDHPENGFVVPYGDGPRPIFFRRVSKSAIQNMLASAREYVYMTTPYLIIDNDLCQDIENTALRGVDVRIIMPHIPDKKIVFAMSRSFYPRLMEAGVKIYEYEPGFVHAKNYLCDDETAMVGTVNLDYRSLVHHFENGVWMHKTSCIGDIRRDMEETLEKCILITPDRLKTSGIRRFGRSLVRIFAPML